MESPIYIALSRQSALKKDLASVANNIANASTAGYRGERTMFQEYLMRTGTPGNREQVSYTQEIGNVRDLTEGPLTMTRNSMDFALRGSGYFVVGNPGQEMYTRTAGFRLDGNRQVVTDDGYPLLDANNQPIVVPQNEGGLNVNAQGIVSTDGGAGGQPNVIGTLKVVRFSDEQLMRRTGTNMYMTDQTPLPATDYQVVQGAIEGSNVQPVMEITRMIDLLRDYQSAQKLVDQEHDRQRDAIAKLSRIA